MRKSASLLNIHHLQIFRERSILKDFSWKIQANEQWVIIGPNGSGKTSLLSAITGYLTPSAGTLEVLGFTYGNSDWRALRKKVGMVSSALVAMIHPQETAFNLVLSGKEAIVNYWGIKNTKDEKKALKILKDIDCLHLKDQTWETLSQGERQKILMGRALMANFKILILDEPCAGLDLVARENFIQFLQNTARSHKAPRMILVTHHIEEVPPAFTHALLIKDGKIFISGKKIEVFNSKNISKLFDRKILVKRIKNRYLAHLV